MNCASCVLNPEILLVLIELSAKENSDPSTRSTFESTERLSNCEPLKFVGSFGESVVGAFWIVIRLIQRCQQFSRVSIGDFASFAESLLFRIASRDLIVG